MYQQKVVDFVKGIKKLVRPLLTIFPNPLDIAPNLALEVKKLMMEYPFVRDQGLTSGKKNSAVDYYLRAASSIQSLLHRGITCASLFSS